MTQAGRALVFAVVLALITIACASSTSVNSTDTPPTPLPTLAPVFIPTTAPRAPTPGPVEPTAIVAVDSHDDAESDTASDSSDADSADELVGDGQGDDPLEPTATAEPTPTAQALPVPTQAPRPTRVPQPTRPPAPRPTTSQITGCAGGGIIVGTSCSCPGGQARRISDNQCVRLCNQADLTINNTCVCTGDLYDNGGQCVKRCNASEVPDNFGGCKLPMAHGRGK